MPAVAAQITPERWERNYPFSAASGSTTFPRLR